MSSTFFLSSGDSSDRAQCGRSDKILAALSVAAGRKKPDLSESGGIAQIEVYAPSANVSELTARVNDDGWDTAYANWLHGGHLGKKDAVFVFSMGGGDAERNVSSNLVRALEFAQKVGVKISASWGVMAAIRRTLPTLVSSCPS